MVFTLKIDKIIDAIFATDTSFFTVRHRGMGTGISEASKRVPIFSFATQGGKQVSSYFRQELGPSPRGSDPFPSPRFLLFMTHNQLKIQPII